MYEHAWSFLPTGSAGTLTIGKGNYEYPFDVLLPSDLPESLEGNEAGQVTYHVRAIIERGTFAKDIVCKKHLRVIRRAAPGYDFTQSQSVENVWPNKVDYRITIPSTVCPIGSPVSVSVTLVPLLKGLDVASVAFDIRQLETIQIPSDSAILPGYSKTRERFIQGKTIKDPPLGENSWQLEDEIMLPSTLKDCSQDCEVGHLKVRHRVKFIISLKNPDGHISELRAQIPITVIIPPEIDEEGRVTPQLTSRQAEAQIPPTYQDSGLDRLWDGVSHVDTPTTTVSNTPMVLSRRGSDANLNALTQTAIASSDHTDEERQRLVASLERLQLSQASAANGGIATSHTTTSNTPFHHRSRASSPHGDHHSEGENPMSRRSSPPTPPVFVVGGSPPVAQAISPSSASDPSFLLPHPDIDNDLSRVPSYGSALRENTFILPAWNSNLPQYEPPRRTNSLRQSRIRAGFGSDDDLARVTILRGRNM